MVTPMTTPLLATKEEKLDIKEKTNDKVGMKQQNESA
jgi:hypothetical protein